MSESDDSPAKSHAVKRSVKWNRAVCLIGTQDEKLPNQAEKPNFATLVNDVQRFAYLYGEDFIGTIHGLTKNDTQDILELSKQKQKQEEKERRRNSIREAADARAQRKLIDRLIRNFYSRRTQKLQYDLDNKDTEAIDIGNRQPPKRFRTPKYELGLQFNERSLSTTRVRQRLCDLMGTDVIRLNDKRYFQKLSSRLQEEYESTMDRQEEARAASEDERLRRLMLEGVIETQDDYRAVVFGEHSKKAQHPHSKKKKRKIKRHSSAQSSVREHSNSRNCDDDALSKSRKEEVVTQVGILSRPSSSRSGKRSALRKTEDKENSTREPTTTSDRPPHHDGILRPSSSCSNSRKTRRVQSAAPRIARWEKDRTSSTDGSDDESDRKPAYDTVSLPDPRRPPSKYSIYEPERVSRLRTAQTVDGLYSIAEELVSPIRADESSDKRVIKPKQKKMTT